jgi:cell wall-associated NlpC family hydrolase
MKRPEVSAAQKLLKQKGYYTGKIDSIYGEASARATRSAKWDLGYAEKNINSQFDDQLFLFLSGKTKPSLIMRQRAKSRNKNQYIGADALDIASRFIGVSEQPPGSNIVMFSNWYGMRGPWCAMFVTYCFAQAKSKSFVKGSKYAYCPYILADAKAMRNGLKIVKAADAQVGDVVLFDWKGDGVPDHVGIVNVPPGKKKTFTSIEGNTSGTNPSDGGMVAAMDRRVSDVSAFVRVLN